MHMLVVNCFLFFSFLLCTFSFLRVYFEYDNIINIYNVRQKKLHPCSFCNNLIKLRSSMPIFASSYLNVFVTKWCKNFTFADQVFFTV